MKPVNVAIIGCGTIAHSAHGPSYAKNPEARIAYCVDIIPERAQSLADQFGDRETQVTTDYHDILQDEFRRLPRNAREDKKACGYQNKRR